MIKRKLEGRVAEAGREYGVVLVTGPRQSGKTTLVKQVFSKYGYFNLELPDIRQFALDDPRGFLAGNQRMIIDEIQHAPELLSYIQGIVDTDKERKFVLTGSQNLLISEKVSQSLAGRVAIFVLLPLSFEELRENGKLLTSLEKQLINGCYPRIYEEKLNPADWYDGYIQTYLERDVRQIKNIGDLTVFQKFLGLLAGRTGQVLNLTSLANDVGVSTPTITDWISILEASYIIFRLQPFFNSWNKRLIKSPKIHFFDSGLVCALLGINNAKELENHPLKGYLFESMVVSEFYKRDLNLGKRPKLYYWREKAGKEIDLINDLGNRTVAIEVKAGMTVGGGLVGNLVYYKKISGVPVEAELVYGGDEEQKRSDYMVRSWRGV